MEHATTSAAPQPAWDIALLFPPQGQWSEADYFWLDANRESKRLMELSQGNIEVLDSPIQLHQAIIAFLCHTLFQNDHRRNNDYWVGADLVMEVVSTNRSHDLVRKRMEYAQAHIPEYWIVDPEQETVTILTLDGDHYAEHGMFVRGTQAQSVVLPGFEVLVDEVFSQ